MILLLLLFNKYVCRACLVFLMPDTHIRPKHVSKYVIWWRVDCFVSGVHTTSGLTGRVCATSLFIQVVYAGIMPR